MRNRFVETKADRDGGERELEVEKSKCDGMIA
jgi:hypothetical protein